MQHLYGSTVYRFLHIYWIPDHELWRYVTSRIAKAASAMCRLSNPLFRKHHNNIRTKINTYRALVLLYGSGEWSTTLACAAKGASYVCSGSSTLATNASVNVPKKQPHHLSYDNAAYAGSDISSACHPPSLYDVNPNIRCWKIPRCRPKIRCADSIKHDLHSSGLDTINAAQVVFDRPQRKAFVSWLPTREPDQGS